MPWIYLGPELFRPQVCHLVDFVETTKYMNLPDKAVQLLLT